MVSAEFAYAKALKLKQLFQMTATVIVAVFTALSAASSGSGSDVGGLLIMLSVCRYVITRQGHFLLVCYLTTHPLCQILPWYRCGCGISLWIRLGFRAV